MDIDDIVKYIEYSLNQNIKILDDNGDGSYYILVEFMFQCPHDCDLYHEHKEFGSCSAYDENEWCDIMDDVNYELKEICQEIIDKFDVVDCYESDEVCNGLYVAL